MIPSRVLESDCICMSLRNSTTTGCQSHDEPIEVYLAYLLHLDLMYSALWDVVFVVAIVGSDDICISLKSVLLIPVIMKPLTSRCCERQD